MPNVKICGLPKLPREAAKRLELLRSTNQYNLEREMYEVYTDMLRRNEEIGMSDLDLQGPTIAEREAQKSIRPELVTSIGCQNEESTALPRPPQLGVYEPLQPDAVMPLDMTPEEMENIQHTELAYNVMRDLCQRKRLCIYQVSQFEDWMKEEKINLQKCRPSKDRILRMAAYNRIVRSFRSSHFTEELQAHKMWRITNLAEYYDPEDAARVPEYKGQFPMRWRGRQQRCSAGHAAMSFLSFA
eukprot:g22660.t2